MYTLASRALAMARRAFNRLVSCSEACYGKANLNRSSKT